MPDLPAYDNLCVSQTDRTLLVRLDRGNAANALSVAVLRDLTDIATRLHECPDLSAVILTGRHDNFCLGQPDCRASGRAAAQRHEDGQA